MLHILVDCNNDIEPRLLGSGQKPAVGQTLEARVAAGLAIMTNNFVA
jgi:hypothetical protein